MANNVEFKSNQIVEAIYGASGLLLGLADLRGKQGMALLAETFIHPQHLGFKEAREMLIELDKMLKLNLNFTEYDKDLKEFEKTKDAAQLSKTTKQPKLSEPKEDLGYIS
jgi:proteasome assembly chaperone (PAC2) family protein